jgi:RNA polymerase sigma-B factor
VVTIVDEVPVSAPAPVVKSSERPSDRRAERDYRDLDPLVAEFARLDPDDPRHPALRDQLVAGFLPVVRHIAMRYGGRGEPESDLVQVGAIGLLNALNRFDPDRSDNFLGYAVPTVTGEMRRHFRDRTWSVRVPRRLKDLQGSIRAAVDELSTELERAPRPSEIANRLAIDAEEVIEALCARDAHTPSSLDALLGPTGVTLGETLGRADAALDKVEYRQALRPLLAELPDRERKIIVLRFFGDLTQTQIAAQMGISQMHVSRLLSQTLATLRRRIEAD